MRFPDTEILPAEASSGLPTCCVIFASSPITPIVELGASMLNLESFVVWLVADSGFFARVDDVL